MPVQTRSAEDYHRKTSYQRNRLTPHSLDWENQPDVVKRYPCLPRILLDRRVELPEIDYLTFGNPSVAEQSSAFSAALDLRKLSSALLLTHDLTARAMHGGTPFYYRSVASAGALYPFELYLVGHDIQGLDSGAYHYNPFDFSLTALRQGPLSILPAVDRKVSATFYVSGIFFRSAWKYRSRAYRYVLLDAGHLMENLRLALKALGLPFAVELDFDDEQAATLLGLDHQREACLAAIHVTLEESLPEGAKGQSPEGSRKTKPLHNDILRASVVSGREIGYEEILNIHRAGNGMSKDPGSDREMVLVARKSREPSSVRFDPPGRCGDMDYVQVLKKRRSRRNFIPGSVAKDDVTLFFGQMFRHMGDASGVPAAYRATVITGLLAGEGMPVDPGFYLMDSRENRLERLSKGHFIEPMAVACLDQMWLKNAAFHLLFITDLAALDRTRRARGYRYAMMEAGRLGQQAYLAATALGWGACGIGAIYDREAVSLLDLSDTEALLYLVGVGPIREKKRKTCHPI